MKTEMTMDQRNKHMGRGGSIPSPVSSENQQGGAVKEDIEGHCAPSLPGGVGGGGGEGFNKA